MSDEEVRNPIYYQKRRMQQKRMQREVRRTQRRLNRLRIMYKFLLISSLLFLTIYLLKMPQWILNPHSFDNLNSPYLEIINNNIVPSQKILSALRRTQVPTQPIFLVKTDYLKESIQKLEPIHSVYIRRFWFPARLQIIVIERTPIVTISPGIDVPPIAFFSSDGKLIGRDYMPLSDAYNTVLVITYGSGDDYRNWDLHKVTNFKKLATLIEAETNEKVEYIIHWFIIIPVVIIILLILIKKKNKRRKKRKRV